VPGPPRNRPKAARPRRDDGLDLARPQSTQDERLRLAPAAPIADLERADRFLAQVGVALRYGPTKGLPLASLYQALAGAQPAKAALARAIDLTNRLLGEARAIEVTVIAKRISLVHRTAMPALYALVRRGRARDDFAGLSAQARTAIALLRDKREITAGDLRQRLGLRFDARQDVAYAALAELASLLIVDRGPFARPASGIPYLSREGYPYHFFHEGHPDLVDAAGRLSVAAAADAFLEAYLNGAEFARVRKLSSLFGAFLSTAEIDEAVARLAGRGRIQVHAKGREAIVVGAGGPGSA